MKKLFIKFNDGSQVTYTMNNTVAHEPYIKRHAVSSIASAVLQQYPKNKYEPVTFVEDGELVYGQ